MYIYINYIYIHHKHYVCFLVCKYLIFARLFFKEKKKFYFTLNKLMSKQETQEEVKSSAHTKTPLIADEDAPICVNNDSENGMSYKFMEILFY